MLINQLGTYTNFTSRRKSNPYKSSFRDNELFKEERDKVNSDYRKYDYDDVELNIPRRSHLNPIYATTYDVTDVVNYYPDMEDFYTRSEEYKQKMDEYYSKKRY